MEGTVHEYNEYGNFVTCDDPKCAECAEYRGACTRSFLGGAGRDSFDDTDDVEESR